MKIMNKQKLFIIVVIFFLILGCGKTVPRQEPSGDQENQASDLATAVNATESANDTEDSAAPETFNEEPDNAAALVTSITVLAEKGGRLTLSPDNTTIAYDKRGDDKFSDVWTMSIDGENKQCLTCDHPLLPTRNVGQPDWHPSGDYLVVQVEKQTHHEGIASGLAANPGAGFYNDLWIIEYGTDRAWLVNELPEGKDHAILHPHFSKDGAMLSWAQAYRAADLADPARIGGVWDLRIADVEIDPDGVMSLNNIRIIQPGENVWYENHGFSPDGQKLIFTSNLTADQSFGSADIYTYDIDTHELSRLTDVGYNEHGQFSPDGSKIIWMSTNENIAPEEITEVTYTDWWIMNADGSEKQRLTYFNQEGHPHFVVWGTVAADFAWLPVGNGFIGYYHTFGLENTLRGEFREVIVRVDFEE